MPAFVFVETARFWVRLCRCRVRASYRSLPPRRSGGSRPWLRCTTRRAGGRWSRKNRRGWVAEARAGRVGQCTNSSETDMTSQKVVRIYVYIYMCMY